jgi:hypothetical protein
MPEAVQSPPFISILRIALLQQSAESFEVIRQRRGALIQLDHLVLNSTSAMSFSARGAV